MEVRATSFQKEVLEKGRLKPLNLIHGEEEYLVKTVVEKLKEKFGSVRVLWGDEASPEDLLLEASEGSVFSASKEGVVVVFRFDELVKRVRRRKKSLEGLLSILRKIKNSYLFAVVPVKLSPEDMSKEPYKTFAEEGCVILADRIPQKRVRELVKRKFEREGGGIEEDALDLLLELCGTDLAVLKVESEKLLTYAGKERVTKETVLKVCVPWEGGSVFELMDAFFSKDAEGILKNLSFLERSGVPLLQVQALFASQLVKLFAVARSVERGGDAEKVFESIGIRHSFARSKMSGYLSKVSSKELRNLIERLYKLDRAEKVFFLPPEKAFREFLLSFALS